jgi:hypothetical protein
LRPFAICVVALPNESETCATAVEGRCATHTPKRDAAHACVFSAARAFLRRAHGRTLCRCNAATAGDGGRTSALPFANSSSTSAAAAAGAVDDGTLPLSPLQSKRITRRSPLIPSRAHRAECASARACVPLGHCVERFRTVSTSCAMRLQSSQRARQAVRLLFA